MKKIEFKKPLKNNILVWAVLGIAFFVVSVPCMKDYNVAGDDLEFHLLRIEGLLSGFEDGQFPVRIQGNWLNGYGYAVSVFYSDMFLLIPALFRLMGFTLSTSYRMFLAVINLAALLIAYQCFRRILNDMYAGAASAVLYLLSTYRIHDVYVRASIGESLAMVFLPLVLYGFRRIFSSNCGREDGKKGWFALAMGLTGVIQSHVLTCEMIALCIFILCIIMIRRVFIKEVFLNLCKAAAAVLILNLWYLVPFADYLINGKFNVGHLETMMFKSPQMWGIYPAHLMFLFYGGGNIGNVNQNGMKWTGGYSVGAALMLAFILWLYLEITKDMKRSGFKGKGMGRLMLGYTVMFFILSSVYFPWQRLQDMGGIVEKLATSLQFPYRFLSLACLTGSVLAGELILYFRDNAGLFSWRHIMILLLGTSVFFGIYHIDNLLNSQGEIRAYNRQSVDSSYVSGGEYLPYQADISLMQRDRVTGGSGVTVNDFTKGEYTLNMDVDVKNGDSESYVELPLLYYRGYEARDLKTGEHLAVEAGVNSSVRVMLPAGYDGEFHVKFTEPRLWRISEAVSLLAAICCILYMFAARKKKRAGK